MLGGNLTGRIWTLHTRVRYFDPAGGRAGLPPDVASLITGMEEDLTKLTLVNLDPLQPRDVVIQIGAYGEHECLWVMAGDKKHPVNRRSFTVRLDPGAGAELTIAADRYANQPTLSFPW